MTPILKAQSVSKTYPNGVEALCGVDLELRRGETLALIGESGCGKTTLLRLFNRLEEPTSGSLQIRDRDSVEHDPIELRRTTGYVQQDGGLLPHWTVGQNVELVPRLLGWGSDKRRRQAAELLSAVGLEPNEFRDRYPRQLSGGQRQRVAIARALAADPDLILLDEPFGALDALTRRDLQQQFAQLKRQFEKSMVLVTHDLDEALRLGDQVAVMRHGRVLQSATPDQLLSAPADPYVAQLIGAARGASS